MVREWRGSGDESGEREWGESGDGVVRETGEGVEKEW